LVGLYVQRCGGRVEIESRVADASRPGEKSGTKVRVWLPLAPATGARAHRDAQSTPSAIRLA
jgi:signal transduction histidine kinase